MKLDPNRIKTKDVHEKLDEEICEQFNHMENTIFNMIDKLPMEYAEAMYKSLKERAEVHLEHRKKG